MVLFCQRTEQKGNPCMTQQDQQGGSHSHPKISHPQTNVHGGVFTAVFELLLSRLVAGCGLCKIVVMLLAKTREMHM
jgi:hypothetical protein